MKDVAMLEKLKDYFTKEYMRLSEEKDNLLSQKIRLETEEKNQKDLFYDRNLVEKRKRLFSPFDGILFELAHKEREEDHKNSDKIQKLEKNVNQIEDSIQEIKDYIQFIQLTQKEETVAFEVTEDLRETLESLALYFQSQYEEIEFLTDVEEETLLTNIPFNEHIVQILMDTIRGTIEHVSMDSVIIEEKKTEDKIKITIYMLLEDEWMDDYTYEFQFKNR